MSNCNPQLSFMTCGTELGECCLYKEGIDGAATQEIRLIDHTVISFEEFYSFTSGSKLAARIGGH